ncbi:MAG: hypothetical protein ACKPJO_27225 [Dolichospermum sp.]
MTTQQEVIAYIEDNWDNPKDTTIPAIKDAYNRRNDTAMQQLVRKIIEAITGTFTTLPDIVAKVVKAIYEYFDKKNKKK